MNHKHNVILRIIGWFGTTLILLAYTLNIFGVINPEGIIYALANIIGSVFVAIRVYPDRNWANVSLQVFFAVIACISLLRIFLF